MMQTHYDKFLKKTMKLLASSKLNSADFLMVHTGEQLGYINDNRLFIGIGFFREVDKDKLNRDIFVQKAIREVKSIIDKTAAEFAMPYKEIEQFLFFKILYGYNKGSDLVAILWTNKLCWLDDKDFTIILSKAIKNEPA